MASRQVSPKQVGIRLPASGPHGIMGVLGERITYEQFSRLPEQAGLQLIDGVLMKEPSPTYNHQACIGTIHLLLAEHVIPRKLGRIVLAPFDVLLSDDCVLQPDVIFVSNERVPRITQKGLCGAPDLAIEVLSPSTRHLDLGRKKELYLEHGGRELWLIDHEPRTVTQLRAEGSEWRSEQLAGGASLISHVVPGLQVPLPAIFAHLE